MALVVCPECGGNVSDKAPACVHCGYPLDRNEIMKTKLEGVEITQEIKDKFNSLDTVYLNTKTNMYTSYGKNIEEKLNLLFDFAGIDLEDDAAWDFLETNLKKISSNYELDKLIITYYFWFLKSIQFEEKHQEINKDKVRFKIAYDRGAVPVNEIISSDTPAKNIGYVRQTNRCLDVIVFSSLYGMEKWSDGHIECLGTIRHPETKSDLGKAYIVHDSIKDLKYTDVELEYSKLYSKYIDAALDCAKKLPSNYEVGFENVANYNERYKYAIEIPKYAKQQIDKMNARQNAFSTIDAMKNKNIPKCNTCGSTNLKKITIGSKVATTYMFGLLTAGRNTKTWHCNNCGTEW